MASRRRRCGEPPETYVCWRRDVPDLARGMVSNADREEVFRWFPVLASERLKQYPDALCEALEKYVDNSLWVLLIGRDRTVTPLTVSSLIARTQRARLYYATVVFPPGIGKRRERRGRLEPKRQSGRVRPEPLRRLLNGARGPAADQARSGRTESGSGRADVAAQGGSRAGRRGRGIAVVALLHGEEASTDTFEGRVGRASGGGWPACRADRAKAPGRRRAAAPSVSLGGRPARSRQRLRGLAALRPQRERHGPLPSPSSSRTRPCWLDIGMS